MNKYKFFSIIPVLFVLLMLSGKTANIGFDEIIFNDNITPVEQKIIKHENVIKGNISVTKDLPEEFYGTWSVISILLETNNPELFRKRSSDIWTFNREKDVIILSNPISGATASITVNEVSGKTAIFSRIKKSEKMIEIETPEITVKEDSFSGTDLIIIKHFKNNERIKTDRVKYKIRGYKISGPTLKDIFAK